MRYKIPVQSFSYETTSNLINSLLRLLIDNGLWEETKRLLVILNIKFEEYE